MLLEDLDQQVRHGVRVMTDRVDVLVGVPASSPSSSRHRVIGISSGMRSGSKWSSTSRPCDAADVGARSGPARTITQLPVFGSVEAPVKAEAAGVGRAPARRLDGNESEPTIASVMVRLVFASGWGACCRKARADSHERGGRWGDQEREVAAPVSRFNVGRRGSDGDIDKRGVSDPPGQAGTRPITSEWVAHAPICSLSGQSGGGNERRRQRSRRDCKFAAMKPF